MSETAGVNEGKKRASYLLLVLLLGLLVTACGESQISDVEHVQRAKQYRAEGNVKASLIELKNALRQNPGNAEARLLLGELYLLVGEGAAAEKELKKAGELGVTGRLLQRLLGESLLLQHRYADLLALLEETDWASSPELLVLRGQAQLGMGRAQAAEASFRQALGLKADAVEASLWLSRVLLAKGDHAAAGEALEAVFTAEPDNVEAWILKGRVAQAGERLDQAGNDFRKAIELLSPSIPRRVEMEARTELAKLLIAQHRFSEATTQVERLLQAAPRHPISNYIAALLAFEQRQYIEARDYLLTVLKSSPDHLKSLFLLGSTNYALGNIEQAEVQLSRVVAAAPALLPARLMLAGIRLRQAQSEQALEMLEPALAQAPDDVRLLAMAGQAALRSGELEKGKRLLQRAIGEQPGEGSLRAQLAIVYLAEGNDAQAIKELEQAIEVGNASLREQSLLVLTHLRRKDLDKALSVAGRLATDNPDSAYLQNLLGVIHATKGDLREARAAFQEALRKEASFTTASLNLVRLDIQAGRLRDARKRLDRILLRDENNVSAMMALAQLADLEKDRPQALKWLERARQANARALAPRLVLARIYLRERELDRAREVVQEALSITPGDPRLQLLAGQVELVARNDAAAIERFAELAKTTPVAAAHFWLGLAHFRAGNDSLARQSVDKALSLDPGHLGAADLRVLLELRAGQTARALEHAGEIQRRHPKSPLGFEREGDIRARLGQEELALKAYEKAHSLGSGTPVLLKRVAILRRSQGDQAANQRLREWLERHPDDARARHVLALAYAIAGQRRQAIGEYRRLLETAPENALALNDIAWLLFQEGQPVEALRYAEKAYLLRPENGPVMDTLGWLKLQSGEIEQALSLLSQAAAKLPDRPEVQYHLAEAMARSGKNAEARQVLEKILASGKAFDEQAAARRLLDSL